MEYNDYSFDKYDYDSYGKYIDRYIDKYVNDAYPSKYEYDEKESKRSLSELLNEIQKIKDSQKLSDEEILDKMDIKVIETWLRKKKLKKLTEEE